jgi:hypothetical protein
VLRGADRAQRHPRLQRGGSGRLDGRLVAAEERRPGARWGQAGAAARALLHRSPRAFGHARSTWTLALLARVAQAQGLSSAILSPETIRQALLRLGVSRRRAKHWLTSPDPAYARKKAGATA